MTGTEPMRTCVGCGERDRQRGMVRLQLDGAGALVPVRRAGSGRSAYVHGAPRCEGALVKTRLLRRSLRRDVDQATREQAARRLALCRPQLEVAREASADRTERSK